jgi:hypothetical protein
MAIFGVPDGPAYIRPSDGLGKSHFQARIRQRRGWFHAVHGRHDNRRAPSSYPSTVVRDALKRCGKLREWLPLSYGW